MHDIAAPLRLFLGQRFWKAHRSVDLHAFHFGDRLTRRRRDGTEMNVGAYALHIQCAWRITAGHRVVVASRDRYTPRGNPDVVPDDFTWDQPKATLCDERLERLLETPAAPHLVVSAVHPGTCGAFTFDFTSGHALEVFPDSSTSEYWRFIDFLASPEPEHYVSSAEEWD